MARSKFFTYSPYIFRKGASFCRMSPIRGFESLQTAKGNEVKTTPAVENQQRGDEENQPHHSSIRFCSAGSRNCWWKQ